MAKGEIEEFRIDLSAPQTRNVDIMSASSAINIDVSSGTTRSLEVGPGCGGTRDYKKLINKPSINGITLIDDLSLEDLGIGDYEPLINHPYINDVELIGNKYSADLKLQDQMDSLSNMDIENLIED